MARIKDTTRQANDEQEDEWEPEDEVAQLITGFESEGEDDESGAEGFEQGKDIPKLPKRKALTAKEKSGKSSDGPGVIYIGRVPHGFHEHEMRAYFSQFGDVNHVRLSRSKKTGRSKHYAFLEFKSEEVAKIAAKTMDKYLLFGHILRCSFVPQERVHPSLWKGADKRFKSVPWAKIEGRKLAAPKGRSDWQKKIEKESKRRASRAKKLQDLDYEFEASELKSVDSVPTQISKLLEDVVIEEEKTIVVAKDGNNVVVSEEIKTKKVKKDKTAKKTANRATDAAAEPSIVGKQPEESGASIDTSKTAEPETKGKQSKKLRKSETLINETPQAEAEPKKLKKDKKTKAVTSEKQEPIEVEVKKAKKDKRAKSVSDVPVEQKDDLDSRKRAKKPSKRALEAAEEQGQTKKPKKSKKSS